MANLQKIFCPFAKYFCTHCTKSFGIYQKSLYIRGMEKQKESAFIDRKPLYKAHMSLNGIRIREMAPILGKSAKSWDTLFAAQSITVDESLRFAKEAGLPYCWNLKGPDVVREMEMLSSLEWLNSPVWQVAMVDPPITQTMQGDTRKIKIVGEQNQVIQGNRNRVNGSGNLEIENARLTAENEGLKREIQQLQSMNKTLTGLLEK